MNVSFLQHSLHYLQVAKRLYCARHHTKSQMLHTKNGLDKQVRFAHRDYHFSRGPSTGKNRKKWRGRGRENNDSLKKKRVPATDVSTHGKMQWLTISFASQLTSGTGIFSSFLKESVVNWGKGHLASHNCKSYKALPNTNAFLWAIHRFSQVHDSWIGLPSPLISHKSSCNTKMNREWTSSYTKFTIALLHPKNSAWWLCLFLGWKINNWRACLMEASKLHLLPNHSPE